MNIERLFVMVLKETLNYYLKQIEQQEKPKKEIKQKQIKKNKIKKIDLEYCPYCNIYTEKNHICKG